MAKKKVRVTDAMAEEVQPYLVALAESKLRRIGARGAAKRFGADARAKRRATTKFYGQYLDEGGKAGDVQSFLAWLVEHADEIIAFISKIIALFSV